MAGPSWVGKALSKQGYQVVSTLDFLLANWLSPDNWLEKLKFEPSCKLQTPVHPAYWAHGQCFGGVLEVHVAICLNFCSPVLREPESLQRRRGLAGLRGGPAEDGA